MGGGKHGDNEEEGGSIYAKAGLASSSLHMCIKYTDDKSVSCIFLSPYPSQNDPLKLASDMSYFHITREEMESQNGYETSSKDTWPV